MKPFLKIILFIFGVLTLVYAIFRGMQRDWIEPFDDPTISLDMEIIHESDIPEESAYRGLLELGQIFKSDINDEIFDTEEFEKFEELKEGYPIVSGNLKNLYLSSANVLKQIKRIPTISHQQCPSMIDPYDTIGYVEDIRYIIYLSCLAIHFEAEKGNWGKVFEIYYSSRTIGDLIEKEMPLINVLISIALKGNLDRNLLYALQNYEINTDRLKDLVKMISKFETKGDSLEENLKAEYKFIMKYMEDGPPEYYDWSSTIPEYFYNSYGAFLLGHDRFDKSRNLEYFYKALICAYRKKDLGFVLSKAPLIDSKDPNFFLKMKNPFVYESCSSVYGYMESVFPLSMHTQLTLEIIIYQACIEHYILKNEQIPMSLSDCVMDNIKLEKVLDEQVLYRRFDNESYMLQISGFDGEYSEYYPDLTYEYRDKGILIIESRAKLGLDDTFFFNRIPDFILQSSNSGNKLKIE